MADGLRELFQSLIGIQVDSDIHLYAIASSPDFFQSLIGIQVDSDSAVRKAFSDRLFNFQGSLFQDTTEQSAIQPPKPRQSA